MDFNRIYEADVMGQGTTPPATSGNPTAQGQGDSATNLKAAQDQVYIVLNQLKLKVQQFKQDQHIIDMIDRYDGIDKTKNTQITQMPSGKSNAPETTNEGLSESTDVSKERLTEAFEKKSTMKYYYKKICNSITSYTKFIVIGAIVITLLLVAKGIGNAQESYNSAMKAAGLDPNEKGPGLLKWVMHKDKAMDDIKAAGDAKKQQLSQANATENGEALKDLDTNNGTAIPQNTEKVDDKVVDDKVVDDNKGNAADLSTWQARVKAGKASDADMEEAYKAYKAGTYTPGPKTLEYFNQHHPNDTTLNQNTPTYNGGDIPPKTIEDTTDLVQDVKAQPNVAYNMWVRQPKIQTARQSIADQLKAAGRTDVSTDDVLKDVFEASKSQDLKSAIRTVQIKYGISDISGKGLTDSHMGNLASNANKAFETYQGTINQIFNNVRSIAPNQATNVNGTYVYKTSNGQNIARLNSGRKFAIFNDTGSITDIYDSNNMKSADPTVQGIFTALNNKYNADNPTTDRGPRNQSRL